MTYDNKPMNSADSASSETKDDKSNQLTDSNSEQSEESYNAVNSDSEIQSTAKSIVDSPSSNTLSSDANFPISSDQNAKSSPSNNGSVQDASMIDGSFAKSSQRSSLPSISSEHRRVSRNLVLSQSETPPICYNPVLDDEIRARLDELNRLSDLINSLELSLDQATAMFNETLKYSTEKLSIIAKSLGSKPIRKGRLYHAAEISVEQTRIECQKACVQFEQANINYQHAKLAIKEAETKLFKMNSLCRENQLGCQEAKPYTNSPIICMERLKLSCETDLEATRDLGNVYDKVHDKISTDCQRTNSSNDSATEDDAKTTNADSVKLLNSNKLSEDLNQAIKRLIEAEEKRIQSEKLHLVEANKLMIAQENLTKLEREHGTSIRRAQVYFEEARRFNAKQNSVKNDINRISEDIVAAKKAYAKTLNELEQLSEDIRIHINRGRVIDSETLIEQ